MSEAEARRAAATFEFPGWHHAEARYVFIRSEQRWRWALAVFDSMGEYRLFESPEDWLETYQRMQREDAG